MYQRNHLFILFCIIILSLALGACGGVDPEPMEVSDKTVEQSATEESDKISALQSISPLAAPPESPLAEPASSVEMPPLEAVYDDETGAMTGQLIFVDENGEAPVPDITLALGTMLKDENGQHMIVSYKAGLAPRTVTDEHGRFVFNEIEPETYALILDAGVASGMLAYPEDDVVIVFDIVANELFEIGAQRYEELPAPGYTK